MKGRLIVIEGIDGAGTEVQSKNLLKFLQDRDIPAVRLSYPDYDTPIGNLVHEFLHNKHEFNTELLFLLHLADRVKDIGKIRQLLNEGRTVVCDRYFTSILAYQCGYAGFPMEKALKMAEMFDIPKPDTIIYLKISPETSIKRKIGEKGEKNELDRNESDTELHKKMTKVYDDLVQKQVWASWFPVDGEGSIEEVAAQIRKILRL
jgi:dTMP kinase